MAPKAKEKKYIVDVLVVPSKLESLLGSSEVRTEKRSLIGMSKSDALKKAGIK